MCYKAFALVLTMCFIYVSAASAQDYSVPDFAPEKTEEAIPEQPAGPPVVHVRGLFTKMAILEINGRQRTLKQGESSPEGVYLVSADSKQAVVRVEGEQKVLLLTRSIGTNYKEAEATEVRLQSAHNGHFFGSAVINGGRVQFMVDTGASSIAMNSIVAERLGISTKKSRTIRVATAQGVTLGHQVTLKKVTVGGIVVRNVDAIVLEGEYPVDVLLGNSFLSQVDMNIDSGVMVLTTKF